MNKESIIEKEKMSNRLPSAHQIGDPVFITINSSKIPGYIRAVIFTVSKVRYGVKIYTDDKETDGTTFHNIDSFYVHEDTSRQPIVFDSDNYS